MIVSTVNVLIVFSSTAAAERLATAAGVGALQARANIRLRRLDVDRPPNEANESWQETQDRLRRDYVTPRPADPLWADVLILCVPADSPAEMTQYLASLPALGPIAGKIAAPIVVDNPGAAAATVHGAATAAGFVVVPGPGDAADPVGAARAHGRRVTEQARARDGGGAS